MSRDLSRKSGPRSSGIPIGVYLSCFVQDRLWRYFGIVNFLPRETSYASDASVSPTLISAHIHAWRV
jgi:hypothetical protein